MMIPAHSTAQYMKPHNSIKKKHSFPVYDKCIYMYLTTFINIHVLQFSYTYVESIQHASLICMVHHLEIT